jgi:hypothetical protein
VAGVTINSNVAASGVTATGGLYGLYITQKTAGLLDFTSGIYIESASSTTGITIMNTTTGLSIAGTATDGILIGGACTDAIHISGTNTTNAIHISGDQAVGILFDVDSSIATGISFAVDTGTTMTTGIDMTCTGTGTITNAISLTYTASATECLAVTLATGQTITTGMSLSGAGTYTTGILLDATALGTGLKISGATTTAIDITGACTRGIRLGTHDWGVGLTGLVLSTTDPLFQVAGRIAASNSTAGVYACAYKQLALTSATQNTDTSWFADWNELYITPTTTTTLTGSSHYAAVKGHVEVSGTVVSSTGVTASLWGSNIIPAGYTNNGIIAGCYVDGIIHTSMTNTGDTMAYGIGAHTDPNQGDWEYGLYMPASTVTTGIYIAGSTTGLNVTSTTQGIYANVTAVAAAGSLTGSALCVYGAGQAGLNDVGIVAYLDATAKGLSTGNWTYGAGIWLNIDSTFAHAVDPKGWADHEQLCPLSVGVYAPSAVGAGIDDNDIIYGIKAELVGDATAPTSNGCYFAALNVSQTAATQTAIFFAHQDAAVGLTTAKTTAGGAIALACVNGTMYYVNVYTS